MNHMWGLTDVASNSVQWAARSLNLGSGSTAQAANNTALFHNVTVGAWATSIHANSVAIGQFGVSANEMANTTSSESKKVQAAGWQLRRAYEGPIVRFTVAAGAAGGSYFANGETIKVTGGSINAVGVITTNLTGNMVSIAITNGGRFANTGLFTYAFQREKHLDGLNIGDGGSGYDNSDFVVCSNGTVDGYANVTTDGSGNIQTITVSSGKLGLWSNTFANGDVVVTVYAANGEASNGSSAVLTANLRTSATGTTVGVLGGRAGRVTYECLVASGHLSDGTADDSYLPQA